MTIWSAHRNDACWDGIEVAEVRCIIEKLSDRKSH
jgi:hypothetical protein